jgi:peptide/nickel transport system permease protein
MTVEALASPATATVESYGKGAWLLFWERFREDRVAVVAAGVIGLLIVIGLVGGPLAAWATGHPSTRSYQDVMEDQFGLPKGPNAQFWFGADGEGRDLFVRTLYGTRTSMLIGVATAMITVSIGLAAGLVAGYYRGIIDTIVSRLADVMLAMPSLLISIGIVAACNANKNGCLGGLVQPGIPLVALVIVLFLWPFIARVVRGLTLSIRELEFVEASRALGAGDLRIMFREILPNLLGPIIVLTTILVPQCILFEAALSYLGLGVPPDTASWGGLLSDAQRFYDTAWWLMLFPGLFLVVTTLAFNLLGDGLRDALDVRSDR